MLVLTRAIGERLVFGDGEVYLQILEIRGNQVRLGIDAPRDISINREEVYEKIKEKETQNDNG